MLQCRRIQKAVSTNPQGTGMNKLPLPAYAIRRYKIAKDNKGYFGGNKRMQRHGGVRTRIKSRIKASPDSLYLCPQMRRGFLSLIKYKTRQKTLCFC